MKMKKLTTVTVLLVLSMPAQAQAPAISAQPAARPAPLARTHALRITVLSTMLADAGIGEWGFAALVEADGNKILYDTGAHATTVLENARELGIDLSQIREVILSHNHADHVGGLVTLRREFAKTNPAAISRVHVGKGIFWSRPTADGGREDNPMIAIRREYESTGGVFLEHDKPAEIFPGVWLTGPVPRVYPERNWSGVGRVRTPEGLVEDTIPEDQTLVFDTDKGLVVLDGCGHAGIINTLEYARRQFRQAPIHAALGGFHLFEADDAKLEWTAGKLKELQLAQLMGAHCTGIESVYQFRKQLGLPRHACVVGTVGAVFELGKGIDPGRLAR